MTPRPVLPLLAALAAVASAASPAAANGVFPSADQIVVDPSDPARLTARTTYGLLVTKDAGATWDWICEAAVGYPSGGSFHPPIAVTGSGAVLAALQDGLSVGADGGCAWAGAGELAGQPVADVSVERADPARAVVIVTAELGDVLWQSPDHGASWSPAGTPLPKGFQSLTVDVAPSDPQRIYVSGLQGVPGALTGWIGRSPDRGQTWELFAIPESDAGDAPYIAGVDPLDPGVLYVRLAGAPGRLFASSDAGETWSTAFAGQGFLRAFAISPDGATVVVGGDLDGVWRAPSATLAFDKVSSVGPRCFAWAAAGLYACATEFVDGFTMGLSVNAGETFEPLLHQPCIRGPLSCDPTTPAGDLCPAAWPAIAMLTANTDCTPDGGAPDGSAPAGGTGAGDPGSGAGGPGGGAPSGGAAGAADADTGADCGCRAAGEQGRGAGLFAALAALGLLPALRRRRRPGPPESVLELFG